MNGHSDDSISAGVSGTTGIGDLLEQYRVSW